MGDSLRELLKFIQIGARFDLKLFALQEIKGLTGSPEGIEALTSVPEGLVSLISLLNDNEINIATNAALCLQNISAQEASAKALLDLDVTKHCPPLQRPPDNLVVTCFKFIFNPESKIADYCCKILSNVSHHSALVDRVVEVIEQSERTFDEIINIFTKKQFNKAGANLHYLGPFLSNLSQTVRVRKFILDKDKCVIQRLLPFTEFKDSLERRGGVIGTLKNCCFEQEFHEWLLSEDVDILPRLLLPLAGPEEFTDEQNDGLPMELQYLPEDKTREEDPDIRIILVETLMQLCSIRKNREFIRDKYALVILGKYHMWEKDARARLACENLLNILAKYEEDFPEDNLKNIDIPEHLQEKFKEEEAEDLQLIENEIAAKSQQKNETAESQQIEADEHSKT